MLAPVCAFADRFSVTLPVGYIGYFVLGYVLSCTNFFSGKSGIRYLVLMSLSMIVCIAVLTHHVSMIKGRFSGAFYEYMSPFVVIYSTCLFLLAKYMLADNVFFNNQWYSKCIVLMSRYSLAIYMFHEFILIFIQKIGINPTLFNPLLSVPLIASGIYIVTFLVIHIFAKFRLFQKNMM